MFTIIILYLSLPFYSYHYHSVSKCMHTIQVGVSVKFWGVDSAPRYTYNAVTYSIVDSSL